MSKSLALIGKSIVIAFLAAVAATTYIFAGFGLALGPGDAITLHSEPLLVMFGVALVGCFAIGLPIAFLTFAFSARHLAQSPTTMAMVTVLAGIMMVLASYVVADETGVYTLGIPAFIAALTFGVLGWYWILRPLRGGAHD